MEVSNLPGKTGLFLELKCSRGWSCSETCPWGQLSVRHPTAVECSQPCPDITHVTIVIFPLHGYCLPWCLFLRAKGFPSEVCAASKVGRPSLYVHSHLPFGSTSPYAATAEVLYGCKQIILRIKQLIWLAWKSSCWLEGQQERAARVRHTGPDFSVCCGLRSSWRESFGIEQR